MILAWCSKQINKLQLQRALRQGLLLQQRRPRRPRQRQRCPRLPSRQQRLLRMQWRWPKEAERTRQLAQAWQQLRLWSMQHQRLSC